MLADLWIKRWARFSRQGLPSIGYPKKAAFTDSAWHYNPDDEPNYLDEKVKAVLDGYKGKPRDILIDYYFMRLSMAEAALKNGLKKSGIQWRIDAIRSKVLRVIKKEA